MQEKTEPHHHPSEVDHQFKMEWRAAPHVDDTRRPSEHQQSI